jgi:hyaluronan synthase
VRSRGGHNFLPFVVFGLLAAIAVMHWVVGLEHNVSVYGMVVMTFLGVKLVMSADHRPATASAEARAALAKATWVAVVPFYNEDPAMLDRCLRSLAEQTVPPTAVVAVDDGSSSRDSYQRALDWTAAMSAAGIKYEVHRRLQNRGKREALAYGFGRHPDADFFVCVDSDTLLSPDALEEARLPFADPRVTGMTGLVLASNRRRNVLTALIDLRYASAFLAERAAYSKLGSVLCCCGSLSAYRGWVVRKYLDDFLSQRFLGKPAVFGDDRRLTNYALLEGRVKLQESAVAWTAVPERIGHYVRQQIRWNKSFWRESVWAITHLSPARPAMWLSAIELCSWIVFTTMLISALTIEPMRTGHVALVWTYLVYVAVLAYARSVRYWQTPSMPGERFSKTERLGTFLVAPLYGLMHIVVLLPLRLWSLVTLRKGSWGTRSTVEVALTPSAAESVRGAA